MTDFHPHGGTILEMRGRVLVFRSRANMNGEEVARLQRETLERIRSLAGKPWAVLGVVETPVLLTADAEAAARAAVPQMGALGLTALAVAFQNPSERPLVEAQTTRIVGKTIPMQFFDRPADAEEWLNSMVGAE